MTDEIMPGCEPFSAPGSSMGVLILHGFTGNPFSMRPLAQRCAEAGYAVELPRLPGHGTSLDDLVPRRWSDFVEVALGAYDELAARSEKVAVVGLSVGGGLTALIGGRCERSRASLTASRWSAPISR
jgi:carboxylesterase